MPSLFSFEGRIFFCEFKSEVQLMIDPENHLKVEETLIAATMPGGKLEKAVTAFMKEQGWEDVDDVKVDGDARNNAAKALMDQTRRKENGELTKAFLESRKLWDWFCEQYDAEQWRVIAYSPSNERRMPTGSPCRNTRTCCSGKYIRVARSSESCRGPDRKMETDFTTAPLALARYMGRRAAPWKSLRGPRTQKYRHPPKHRTASCKRCFIPLSSKGHSSCFGKQNLSDLPFHPCINLFRLFSDVIHHVPITHKVVEAPLDEIEEAAGPR